MGLFWSDSKPGVSKTEFNEKVLRHLSFHDWSSEDRELVKEVFDGHLNESSSQSGIDKDEIERGIKILKKSGKISNTRLDDLEQYMISLC